MKILSVCWLVSLLGTFSIGNALVPSGGVGVGGKEVNRREALQNAAQIASLATAFSPLSAFASENIPAVLVLGASGKTGRECVNYLLNNGIRCIATTRTGLFEYSNNDNNNYSKLLSVLPADVTNPSSLQSALGTAAKNEKLAGVIYAASASKKGGSAAQVDCEGVIETAKICIAEKIPRFVLVSSGGVSKPDSSIYKLLNLFGKIMEEKIKGEDQVRKLYADYSSVVGNNNNLGYTIVRPGGLTTEPAVGASALELNQGDTKSGRLPRADVAALCVESIFSDGAFDTTFECYEADTAKSLDSVGFSNIMKSKDPTPMKTGKERRGDTYKALLEGLERDVI